MKETGLDIRVDRISAVVVWVPKREAILAQFVSQERNQGKLHSAKIPGKSVRGVEQGLVEKQNHRREQRKVNTHGSRAKPANRQSPTTSPVPYDICLDFARTPILAVLCAACLTPAFAQRELSGSAQARQSLDRLNVVGSVLMIAAHPDDENTALLAYLARGRKVRTGYLSLTRGEGGQNLIGAEQGDELGIIRTQELLAARRIDGAEQFFTRAIDFGFHQNASGMFREMGPR